MSDSCENCAVCILASHKVFTISLVTYTPGNSYQTVAYHKGFQDYGAEGDIPVALICLARDAFKNKLSIGSTNTKTLTTSSGRECEVTVKRVGRFKYQVGFRLTDDEESDGEDSGDPAN